MMGGQDIVVYGDTDPGELPLILQQFQAEWPKMVVEDAIDGTRVGAGQEEIKGRSELLIYKDHNSLGSWLEHGLTSENELTMVQLIFLADSITLVIDGAGRLNGMAENVRNRLTACRLSLPQDFYIKLVERAA